MNSKIASNAAKTKLTSIFGSRDGMRLTEKEALVKGWSNFIEPAVIKSNIICEAVPIEHIRRIFAELCFLMYCRIIKISKSARGTQTVWVIPLWKIKPGNKKENRISISGSKPARPAIRTYLFGSLSLIFNTLCLRMSISIIGTSM